MKIFLRHALAAVALISAFTACSEDDPKDSPEPKIPRVELSAVGEATEDSLSFLLTSTDADRSAWMILEGEATAPAAADILASGTVVDDPTRPVTVGNLQPATGYRIYAAASLGEGRSEVLSRVAMLLLSTAAAPEPEPEPEPEPVGPISLLETTKHSINYAIRVEESQSYRHLVIMQQVLDNFTSATTDDQQYLQMVLLMLQIYGSTATGPAEYLINDLDQPASGSRPHDIVAGTQYVIMYCGLDGAGNAAGSVEMERFKTPDPDLLPEAIVVENHRIDQNEAAFRLTGTASLSSVFEQVMPLDRVEALLSAGGEEALRSQLLAVGSRTTDLTALSEWVNLNPATDYVLLALGIDAAGDQTALIRHAFSTQRGEAPDTQGIRFDRVVSTLLGGPDDRGVYEYYFELADCEVFKDPEYGDIYPVDGPGNILMCDFLGGQPTAEGRMPEGTYAVSGGGTSGTLDSYWTWAALYDEAGEMTSLDMSGGSITVAYRGDDYLLTIDLLTSEGYRYTGSYSGPIAFDPQPSALRGPAVRRMERPARR